MAAPEEPVGAVAAAPPPRTSGLAIAEVWPSKMLNRELEEIRVAVESAGAKWNEEGVKQLLGAQEAQHA